MQFCTADDVSAVDSLYRRDSRRSSRCDDDHIRLHLLNLIGISLFPQFDSYSQPFQLSLQVTDDRQNVLGMIPFHDGRNLEQSSEPLRLLDKRHLVAAKSRDSCGPHARGPAAYHHHFLTALGLVYRVVWFAHKGVYAAPAASQAGVAGGARSCFVHSAGGDLVGVFRVCLQASCHTDKIGLAFSQGLFPKVGVETAYHNDRDGDLLSYLP
ncbi:MAG: hypothetical protein L7F78_14645, partial [Syntrophales bacterium LBB04]|nr:hypothetical protein [Syntrophales bacterium LBB04]